MQHFFTVLISSAALLGATAVAQNLSSQDRDFIQEAAKGGMMEVHVGKIAQQNGQSAAVKSFGARLVAYHTKANNELMALAQKKGVTITATAPGSSPSGLDSKTGAAFDSAFAKSAVDDHEKDIKAFETEASSGQDPDVKSWAAKTLPTLRAHLSAAKNLKQ